VWKTEEKGSDVNIATRLLLGGQDRLYDEAIVTSGDSHLVESIREANRRYGPVHLRNPRDVHSDLALASAPYGRLDSTLPPRFQVSRDRPPPDGRSVTRPATWR
jgi:hypothetical protein